MDVGTYTMYQVGWMEGAASDMLVGGWVLSVRLPCTVSDALCYFLEAIIMIESGGLGLN